MDMRSFEIHLLHTCRQLVLASTTALVFATTVRPASAEGMLDLARQNSSAFSLALQAQRMGEFEHAQQLWEAVLRVAPQRPEVFNNLAALAYARGDQPQALRLIKQAAALPPHYASIQYNLAHLRDTAPGQDAPLQWTPIQLQLIEGLPAPGTPVVVRSATTTSRRSTTFKATQPVPSVDENHPPTGVVNQITLVDELSLGSSGQVRTALYAWLDSWMQRDIGAYLAFYDSSFSPREGLNRIQWELQRHVRLRAIKHIAIHIADLQVSAGPDVDTVLTRFVQHYRSDSFQNSTLKTLLWRRQNNGQWRISAETTRP